MLWKKRISHLTHLESILSQKNWTGLAGGVKYVCVTLDSSDILAIFGLSRPFGRP